ncbi:flavin reductase family protein (plasmid) [Sphingobium sp. SJ10-10]|uniref:flavin reductase family protein n=1 Tax=Sphingobium sp. SJ10-10 TaxID=3114999 RepID=UPI002E17BB2C|nr:flavin reductase family protein [Sphingobium sp. SJ10-10]
MSGIIESSSPVAEADAMIRDAFIRQMRKVPAAMAVIATQAGDERRGLVATAWCSLSADPPSLMVAVNKNASAHDLIAQSGKFSVNQLRSDHGEIVAIFSNQRGLQGSDRFSQVHWRDGRSGVPVLLDAITAFECHVAVHHEFGSHTIFIGEVTDLWAEDCESAPGVYCNGSIHSVIDAKRQINQILGEVSDVGENTQP